MTTNTHADLDHLVDALDEAGIAYNVEFFGAITIAIPDGSTLCMTADTDGYEVRQYVNWAESDEGDEVATDVPAFEAVRIAGLALAGTPSDAVVDRAALPEQER
jgi:hypothetical protein